MIVLQQSPGDNTCALVVKPKEVTTGEKKDLGCSCISIEHLALWLSRSF